MKRMFMKTRIGIVFGLICSLGCMLYGCHSSSSSSSVTADEATINQDSSISGQTTPMSEQTKIIYLHHSTGNVIWNGGVSSLLSDYNADNGTSYAIEERAYPSAAGYGWNNYPYDYWNIWVEHAGNSTYKSQDTLEILTQDYDVIVFKHCYPVSKILEDTGSPDISSSDKRIENYELQYNALKEKLHTFANTRFIVWTGAALVAGATNAEQGARARSFFTWVKNTWDEPGDNIYVWDFFELETEGGNYLKDEYAAGSKNSHPKSTFAAMVAPYFVQRLVDVIEGRGDTTSLTGQ